MSKEQVLEELLKMIKEGNITDYDAELASYWMYTSHSLKIANAML